MEYRTLPGTDLKVSAVCMGTQQFTGSGEDGVVDVTWGSISQDEVTNTVHQALDSGINFFDCALGYGAGQAERALGKALKGRRHEAIIATKFGKHQPLWTLKPNAPSSEWCTIYDGEMISAAIEESLKNLQIDRIDLYQIHWPVNVPMNDAEKLKGVVKALEAAKAEGKIGHYGVCNFGTGDLTKFLEAGGRPVTNQIPYNLVFRAAEYGVLKMCKHHGISVLCYSALQQGLLSGKISEATDLPEGRRRTCLFKPAEAGGAEKALHARPGIEEDLFGELGVLQKLKNIAQAAEISLVDAATAWLLRRTEVVLVGASSAKQVERNAKIVSIDDNTDNMLTNAGEGIKTKLGPEMDQYWISRVEGNSFSDSDIKRQKLV
jgi:aryl-alcohol dehydrogenase-like predicted oxidoreductase